MERFSDDGYKHYYVTECGFKYNMTDIQAALGSTSTQRIEENWTKRKNCWNDYIENLRELPLDLPAPTPEHMRMPTIYSPYSSMKTSPE